MGSRYVFVITVAVIALTLGLSLAVASGMPHFRHLIHPHSPSTNAVRSLISNSASNAADPAAFGETSGDMLDCPPPGPGPEDVQSRSDMRATTFELIGTVASFDAVALEVDSPAGHTSAKLAPDVALSGDLSAGAIVEVDGDRAPDGTMSVSQARSLCPGRGIIHCTNGYQPQFSLKVSAKDWSGVGVMQGPNAGTVEFLGPSVIVQAPLRPDAHVQANLKPGDAIAASGIIGGDGRLWLARLDRLCALPAPAGPAPTATPKAQTPGASPTPPVFHPVTPTIVPAASPPPSPAATPAPPAATPVSTGHGHGRPGH